jgi:hypothetical protein
MDHPSHVLALNRIDPLPTQDQSGCDTLECGYRNASDRMVIVRCTGPDSFYLERVVFPFEVLVFQCPALAKVEIWTHGLGGPELLESSQAEAMAVLEPMEAPIPEVPYGETPWLAAG